MINPVVILTAQYARKIGTVLLVAYVETTRDKLHNVGQQPIVYVKGVGMGVIKVMLQHAQDAESVLMQRSKLEVVRLRVIVSVNNVGEQHTRAEIHVYNAQHPVLHHRSKFKVVTLHTIVFVILAVLKHSVPIMYVQHARGHVQTLIERLQHVLQVPIVFVKSVLQVLINLQVQYVHSVPHVVLGI